MNSPVVWVNVTRTQRRPLHISASPLAPGRVPSVTTPTSSLIDDANWPRLTHAYAAATDTPAHLQALVQDDDDAFAAALDHLYGTVLHQGTVYPATGPSLRVVAAMLDHDAVRRAAGTGSRLAELLGWIDAVADSASWHRDIEVPDVTPSDAEIDVHFSNLEDDDEWASDTCQYLWSRAAVALPDDCAAVLPAVGRFVSDADDAVRLAALDAYVHLAALQDDRAALGSPLLEALGRASTRDERAVLVLGLGDLGVDTTAWLSDDDAAVRACAAMSLAGSAEATAVLVNALQDPLAADEWFERRPSRFDMRVHFGLLQNLLVREVGLGEILPACLAVIRVAQGGLWADMSWGPVLRVAFPGVEFKAGVRPDPPSGLDESQRAVLRALVANDALWDPRDGNAGLARMRVGLSDKHEDVAQLVGD